MFWFNKALLYLATRGTMIYGNVPMTIPILATGYLLTIYLLLVLAQRHSKEPSSTNVVSSSDKNRSEGVRG